MTKPKKKQPLGQSIGGVLFAWEQQVLRNQPPPHELVHHARPDAPAPALDGGILVIDLPDDASPDHLAGLASDLATPTAGLAAPAAPAAPADPEKD